MPLFFAYFYNKKWLCLCMCVCYGKIYNFFGRFGDITCWPFISQESLNGGTKPSDLLWHQLDISIVLNVSCQPEHIFLYSFLPFKITLSFQTKINKNHERKWSLNKKRFYFSTLRVYIYIFLLIRKSKIPRFLRK